MNVKDIFNLLPNELFDELSAETSVNFKVKKLDGKTVFILLLYSLLNVKDTSLRVLETTFNSFKFKSLMGLPDIQSIRYSSISDRITTINYVFFERIFDHCVQQFKDHVRSSSKLDRLVRFDSTLVSLSSKLLKIGFQCGGGQQHIKQLKFTIGYSNIPETANFYHNKTYNSENVALLETIMSHQTEDKQIVIVDAGLQSRKAYDKINESGRQFITRIRVVYKHEIEVVLKKDIITHEGLKVIKDHVVWLFDRNTVKTKIPYRVVHIVVQNGKKELALLTNIMDLSAVEIAEIYRKRWDIEVFFKFLKQQLNFKHLVNRSTNGIKVMLYTTMALSILLSLYKLENKLSGYKIPKLKFTFELEAELIKQIVILSGGNPNNINPKAHFF